MEAIEHFFESMADGIENMFSKKEKEKPIQQSPVTNNPEILNDGNKILKEEMKEHDLRESGKVLSKNSPA